MILKTCFLLMASVAWDVSGIEGISYSQVYVQSGPETAPVEYFKYGASPNSFENPRSQIAHYNTAPVGYEPFVQTYRYGTACPSGACIYPEQTVASIAPAAPSANYLAYGAGIPNLPYVYEHNEPLSYSYVLVNNGAGQNLKLSGGEVFNEGYSFLQPEGFAQYVTDDNQGLNAIIKTYIPNDAVAQTETVNHEIVHHESVHHAEPCHEAKSAALTAHESHEEDHKEHHEGHKHDVSGEESKEVHEQLHESHEARHGSHEASEVHEYIVQESDSKSHAHKDHIDVIVIREKDEHHESEPEEHHKTGHEGHEHEHIQHEGHEHEHVQHEGHENQKTEHEVHQHEKLETTHESDHTHEAIIESHEHHENHEHHESTVPVVAGNNVYISYNDFIRCIQAAVARGNAHPYYTPVAKPTSPLTYLIFNKPC